MLATGSDDFVQPKHSCNEYRCYQNILEIEKYTFSLFFIF